MKPRRERARFQLGIIRKYSVQLHASNCENINKMKVLDIKGMTKIDARRNENMQ